MTRPTKVFIEPSALINNVLQIKQFAPNKKIVAMVKANAYGCGVNAVVPVLEGHVDAFGVACLDEALAIRALGSKTHCILYQGVFSADEYHTVARYRFGCALHTPRQLQWLLNTRLPHPVPIWIKVNTGMNRLGFQPNELQEIMDALQACSSVDKDVILMTHMACADEPEKMENAQQITLFQDIEVPGFSQRSMANSAAIVAFPQAHADIVRAGIMLYGVSPFAHQNAAQLGLIPVMRFMSTITAIHHIPPLAQVGYSGTWRSNKPSVIGVVAAGYGDGYPRHISANTPVWVKDREVMIVGRVSMDMLTIDLTDHPDIEVGDVVELWGEHIPVERIAASAGTIGYELLCQITERVR